MVPKTKSRSAVVTVMFIDIVGYTRTTSQLSRDKFNELHDIFDSVSLTIFEKHYGNVVKKIGDAFMITFSSATDAVLCGIELQNAFLTYNEEHKPAKPIQIRVAIHTGEAIIRGNDVYGDAVNTAARIEGITRASHIVFSESVFAAMNKNEIPYIHLGMRRFKGLKYPLRLFRVKRDHDEIIRTRRIKRRRTNRVIRNMKYVALGVLLLIALLISFILFLKVAANFI